MISISSKGSKVKREKVTWMEAFKSEGIKRIVYNIQNILQGWHLVVSLKKSIKRDQK